MNEVLSSLLHSRHLYRRSELNRPYMLTKHLKKNYLRKLEENIFINKY
jgi:hypothetical protein